MIAEVIVDVSTGELDRVFEYVIPTESNYVCGDRVKVPFGKKTIEGFIINVKETPNYQKGELKEIIERIDDFTCLSPEMLALSQFMVKEFHLRINDTLRLFIPSEMRGARVSEKSRLYVTVNREIPLEAMLSQLKANSVQQKRLLTELYSKQEGEWQNVLCETYSQSTITLLAKKNFIIVCSKRVERTPLSARPRLETVELNEEQQAAMDAILYGKDSEYLLHGVTGSGKTEVYIRCIRELLKKGKNAIMLVPEISLTPLMMSRLKARFGGSVAVLHSGLSAGERFDEWMRLKRGDATIAIGARSAIFAPVSNLGIIIIDEEHDTSYISERNPRYFTHVIAEFRAKYNDCKLVLGSATPDIDTYYRAKKGDITLLELNNRANKGAMPEMQMVNMCKEVIDGNVSIFSRELVSALKETLDSGNQAMLYINRRGYASFMMCRKCGYVFKCSECDVSLTYHQEDNMMKCHYCGARFTVPTRCPNCNDEHIRMGRVGTERVVSELKRLFPKVKTLRMDNDTTRTKESYINILQAFEDREADVLVGTQMIAKGHDFANVTLVGILDADLSLYLEDFRSSERTFQLITQVAGRAGRADKQGKVIVQSYSPKHYVFQFARNYDYKGFYEKESNTRQVSKYPPFTKIVRLLFAGTDEKETQEATRLHIVELRKLEQAMPDDFIYLQAMKSPIKRIESKFRCQILMRIKRDNERKILERIYAVCDRIKLKNVTCFVEINPLNLN